jgi:hypothetical protein
MNRVKNLCLIILTTLAFSSCQDKTFERYVTNEPIYMSYAELSKSFSVQPTHALENPGKIFFVDDYILINEYMKGIHVYNNTNPAAPVYQCFLNIPGNIDMAVNGSFLFADSYVDMVTIDISNPSTPTEVNRYTRAFSYILPPTGNNHRIEAIDINKGVVVNWNVKTVEREVKTYYYPPYPMMEYGDALAKYNTGTYNGGAISGTVAKAGSMARFMLINQYLYAIDNGYSIKIFELSGNQYAMYKNTFYAGGMMETLFYREPHLFIGGQSNMTIYNLTNPTNPVYVSSYTHITGCDPVVVSGDYAYVTLRNGNNCGSKVNQLDVVNISNIQSPQRIVTLPLTNPHGLGIDQDKLFVCDGAAGLRVFNISNPSTLSMQNQIARFENAQAFDVIPINGILILIGEDGLFQYQYENNQIQLLSKIDVKRK